MVRTVLEADDVYVSPEELRAACVDRQVDSKGELTVAAALSVAAALKRANA